MTRCYWWPTAARGSWDQGIVEELTAGFDHDPEGEVDEGAVVVIAGQHSLSGASLLADLISRLPWCLTIITSDEEAAFPIDLLLHDDKHAIWGQYHARPEFDRVIPIGLPPNSRETLAVIAAERPCRMGDVFFAGQNTHERRDELLTVMKDMACDPRYGNLVWFATSGFRAGLDQELYLRGMRDARIAPCPSGYHSLDSFRLYEALAAGCIPIVERYTPDGPEGSFWDAMFGTCPIPQVDSWYELPNLVQTIQQVTLGGPQWIDLRDEIQAWWADYRRGLAADFSSTIERLKG